MMGSDPATWSPETNMHSEEPSGCLPNEWCKEDCPEEYDYLGLKRCDVRKKWNHQDELLGCKVHYKFEGQEKQICWCDGFMNNGDVTSTCDAHILAAGFVLGGDSANWDQTMDGMHFDMSMEGSDDMDWDMNFDGLFDEMSWGPAHDRNVYDSDTWLEFGCPNDVWEAYGLTACWIRRKWDEQG